jgi:hypothetical protein
MTDTNFYQKNLPQKMESLKERHVGPNFKNQTSSMLKDSSDNNITVNVSYPPHMLVDNSEETPDKIKRKLVGSYIQRTMRTSIRVDFCALSHKNLEENELETYSLPSFYHILEDVYYKYVLGVFKYDPKYKHRLPYLRTTCELEDKLCFKHNLQGKILNVKRTSGGTTPLKISNDNPLSIDRHGNVMLRMYLENDLYKCVSFNKVTKKDRTIPGFVEVNENIFNKDFVLKLGIEKLDVDWYETEREEWKKKFSNYLDTVSYFCEDTEEMCPLKYEFYEYSGDVFEKDLQERILEQEKKNKEDLEKNKSVKDQNDEDQSDKDQRDQDED